MPVSIGAILSRAFQIVINNRVLWALGLLTILFTTQVSLSLNPGFNTSTTSLLYRNSTLTSISTCLGCLSFLLFLGFFILRAAFEAGLVSAGDRTAQGSPPTLREAWAAGRA